MKTIEFFCKIFFSSVVTESFCIDSAHEKWMKKAVVLYVSNVFKIRCNIDAIEKHNYSLSERIFGAIYIFYCILDLHLDY